MLLIFNVNKSLYKCQQEKKNVLCTLELISLTFVLLFATAQPLQSCLIIPVHVKVRRPPPHLDCYSRVHMKPLSLNQPISS